MKTFECFRCHRQCDATFAERFLFDQQAADVCGKCSDVLDAIRIHGIRKLRMFSDSRAVHLTPDRAAKIVDILQSYLAVTGDSLSAAGRIAESGVSFVLWGDARPPTPGERSRRRAEKRAERRAEIAALESQRDALKAEVPMPGWEPLPYALSTTMDGTPVPDKDAEIARLRAGLAEAKLHLGAARLVAREMTADLAAARAALDRETDLCRGYREFHERCGSPDHPTRLLIGDRRQLTFTRDERCRCCREYDARRAAAEKAQAARG